MADSLAQLSARMRLRHGRTAVTVREAEVLRLIAAGHTSSQIAAHLRISPRTVEHHRASLMRKLKCRNKAELVRSVS